MNHLDKRERRFGSRSLTAVAALALACGASAIHASCPGPGAITPLYFSGTKCIATGWVQADTYLEQVVEMWLYIGGELVDHWVKPDGEFYAGGSLTVCFDSSHFPPQTNLEVRIRGKNDSGVIAEATMTAPVKNRAIGFTHPTFEATPGGSGVTEFLNQLAGKNYDLLTDSISWDDVMIYDRLTSATIYLANSHANNASHYSAKPINGSWQHIFGRPSGNAPNYEDFRASLNGAGLPPINSTENPPVTFAHFLGCNMGLGNGLPDPNDGNNFSSILKPYHDAYGNPPAMDQANMGCGGFMRVSESTNHVWWIEGYMADYWATVIEARQNLLDNNSLNNHPVRYSSDDVNWSLVEHAWQYPIWGDWHTRIKGVYTGAAALGPGQWYIKLGG